MDYTKKKILESIGFVVGTPTEFTRFTEAEALYRNHFQNDDALKRHREICETNSPDRLPQDRGAAFASGANAAP